MGLATAQMFAEAGAAVALTDFKEDLVKDAAEKLGLLIKECSDIVGGDDVAHLYHVFDLLTLAGRWDKPSDTNPVTDWTAPLS